MEIEEWKLVILGKRGVGTTTFVIRHIQSFFIEEIDIETEMWMESYRKQLQIDDRYCLHESFDLWFSDDDTHPLTDHVMRAGQGFIVAYSSTDRSSFQKVPDYIERVKYVKDCPLEEIPVILVETKCDLAEARQVSIEEGQALAAQYGLKFLSTSSLTGQNVNEAVIEVIRLLRVKAELERFIKKNGGKRPIPAPKIQFPSHSSTLITDISTQLFDNPTYSDLTIMVDKRPIHVHKAVLFGRLPSFMEKIKQDDKVIDLESSMTYPVVHSIFKYVYLGKFERALGATDAQYKAAIMKWEVFNLLPVLKNEEIESFTPAFERLFNLNFMSDLKIIVNTSANDKKQKQQTKEIYCHKMILCARSEYFRAMYSAGFKESSNTELIIDDCSYEAVLSLIKYYYLDAHEIEDESLLMDLLQLANRYNERQVLQMIARYLHKKITIESVCYILALCELFVLDDNLKQACNEFVSYRFNKVAKTAGFKQLSPETRAALEAQQAPGLWYVAKEKQDEAQLIKLIKNLTL